MFSPAFARRVDFQIGMRLLSEDDRVLTNPRGNSLQFDETSEFRGKGRHFSADELFLCSVLASLGNTFLYFSRRRKTFSFASLELNGSLSVEYDEDARAYRITRVNVQGRLFVPEGHQKVAARLWSLTERTCHVIRSVDAQVRFDLDVRVEVSSPVAKVGNNGHDEAQP
ncbi:MAG: hypothetical protein Kow0069_11140 [Promethearchaeota archaeon]